MSNFRQFHDQDIVLGKMLTAIAGNNGTGKSTVLGLLANSSQLTGHKTLLGKPYRGEFSELFRASKDHDPAGNQVILEYLDHGTPERAVFKTSWQNGSRFRVIPRRRNPDGTKTSSKINSPVIYLGLSRLFPVGEAGDGIEEKSQRWSGPDEEAWFSEKYADILSIHDPILSLRSISISGLSSKRGTGVETETYGPTTNSAGQDNLGQILLAILSFRRLKKELGDDWDGGLLLIDEIDAALHPAAQRRLMGLLIKECKATGFQAVFTTHSETVLQFLSDKNQNNPDDEPGNIEVSYLSCANAALEVRRNPSWSVLHNGLLVTNPALSARQIGVFTEDAEARWFVEELVKSMRSDLLSNVSLLPVALGCDQIMTLYSGDFTYFRERIVVFDGDVTEDDIDGKIPAAQRKTGKNIVILPGTGKRPESVLWEYLSEKPNADSSLWRDMNSVGISWHSLVESGPNSGYFAGQDERNRYKKWFKTYEDYFERAHVVQHWVQDNEVVANEFMSSFLEAYNAVAKRLMAPELPMKTSK